MAKSVRTLGLVLLLGLSLMFLLQACGGSPPPNPVDAEADLGLTELAILDFQPAADATDVSPSAAITVGFDAAQDRGKVEAGFALLPGSVTANPNGLSKLQLTSMCNGKWRVRNPNSGSVVYRWDVYNTSIKGSGVVPAGADVYFYTPLSKTVRLFIGSKQQQSKASNPAACDETAPDTAVPGAVAGSFAWNEDSTRLTFQPAAALGEYALYSFVLGLNTPFASSFTTGAQSAGNPVGNGDFTARVNQNLSEMTFTANGSSVFTLSAASPSWQPASHTFRTDVTLTNTSADATYQNVRAVFSTFAPASVSSVNPSGYTSAGEAFVEFGNLAAGETKTLPWTFYSPEDATFTFDVSLLEAGGVFELSSVSSGSFTNDSDKTVTVSGQGIRAETAFFIQSNQLTVNSWSETQAVLTVPAGFPPANYGLMAVNPDGGRAVLYPAFNISEGSLPPALEPKDHAFSYVEGYVMDYTTEEPIAGARVSIPGLETVTGPTGYYLLRGVPQGRQPVEIQAEGYETVYRFAEVTGEEQTVTLKYAALEPVDPAVTMIGPAGGVHHASNGAFLEVPAGVLDSTVPIQFTHTRSAATIPELPEDGYYLAFAKLGPSGLTFKKPATLFLPLQDELALPEGTPIRISYFDEKDKRWVQDITGGVITNVNGQPYLEYEINHFTWIGGQWQPDKVEGCVKYQDGSPAVGVSTNYGTTDENGVFHGTTTSGPRKRSEYITLTARAIGVEGGSTPTYKYYGSRDVKFDCIILPTENPYIAEPYLEEENYNNCYGGYGGSFTAPPVEKSFSVESRRLQSEDEGDNPLVLADNITKIETSILNTSQSGINLSTLRFFIGDKDVTSEVDITYPRLDEEYDYPSGTFKKIFYDDLSAQLFLTEPLPTGANLEIRFGGTTKSGKQAKAVTKADVVAGFETKDVLPLEIPLEAWPAEWNESPHVYEGDRNIVVAYQQQDVTAGRLVVEIPVRAVGTDGKTVPVDLTDARFLSMGDYSGSADFVDGVARIPVNIIGSEDENDLDLGTIQFGAGQYGSLSTARVGTPNSTSLYGCYDVETEDEQTPRLRWFFRLGIWTGEQIDKVPLIVQLIGDNLIADQLPIFGQITDGVSFYVDISNCKAGDKFFCYIAPLSMAGLAPNVGAVPSAMHNVLAKMKVLNILDGPLGRALMKILERNFGVGINSIDDILEVDPQKLAEELRNAAEGFVDLAKRDPLNFEKNLKKADELAVKFKVATGKTDDDVEEILQTMSNSLKNSDEAGISVTDFLEEANNACCIDGFTDVLEDTANNVRVRGNYFEFKDITNAKKNGLEPEWMANAKQGGKGGDFDTSQGLVDVDNFSRVSNPDALPTSVRNRSAGTEVITQTKASGEGVKNNQIVRAKEWAGRDPDKRTVLITVYADADAIDQVALNTAKNARAQGIDIWFVSVDANGVYSVIP